ncbi:uncharacterized protein LOC127102262 [Lathyrus oleraceus]|uniref:uncharacterized protein LOC127102262 n=1 Tax=Pisum sativum TaxID=3888 RepID=UPI0021D3352F|nr:uncharacterized protein LOC127102262 [Pisum sativum]
MTIAEYADKFDSLAKHFRYFCDNVDENYKCGRFEQGLIYEIKESVEPLEIRQFQDLVEKCKKVERMKQGRLYRGVVGGLSRPQGHQYHNNRGKQQQPYTRPQRNGRDQPRGHFKGGQKLQNSGTIQCYHCNKERHVSTQCLERARLCYLCQQLGHFAKDYRAPRRDHIPSTNKKNDIPRPTAKGRVYHIGGEEASNASGLVQSECEIANKQFVVLFDSGATHSFISVNCVNSIKLHVIVLPFDLVVTIPSTEPVILNDACLQCPLNILGMKLKVDLICIPLKHLGAILGMD